MEFTKITPTEKRGYELRENDVIELSELGPCQFIRWKRGRKSFEAVQLSTGAHYSCRRNYMNMSARVIGKVEVKIENDAANLTEGDLFVIQTRTGKSAELFRYVRYERGKIIAVNPLDGRTWKLDASFTCTAVEKLKF